MRGLIALVAAGCAAAEPVSASRAPLPELTSASRAAAAEALADWAAETRPSPAAEADLVRLETAVLEVDTLLRLGILDEAGRSWENAAAIRKGITPVDRKRLGPRLTAAERRLHLSGVSLLERLVAAGATAATVAAPVEH
ncbi:MAG: hypothetical protein RLZZ127_1647 [Planctomycetota bacterium]|jgi:hypothetical protein